MTRAPYQPARGPFRFSIALFGAAVTLALPTAAQATEAAAVTCNGLAATMTGTAGDDILFGTNGADVIVGLAGRRPDHRHRR